MLGHLRKLSMLNQDFRDMLLCLKEAGVDFMIVGAYALAAHGFPRATGDIDIWVRNSSDNANRVMSALAKFGAPQLVPTDFGWNQQRKATL
jgi:hypothetical protein